MTYESIKDLLDAIGLPYTYHHWDEENVPELPWIVFDRMIFLQTTASIRRSLPCK